MMSNHKVALVTGSARRVGAALIEELHAAGFNVVIHYRHSADEARALESACCKKRADSAVSIQADLSDTAALTPLIDKAAATWGRLDVLINNASSFFPTALGDTTEADWQDLMSSNLMAPYFLSQAATPYLKKTRGCIINMTDVNVATPMPNYPVYCAAKAGLNSLTRSLAVAMGPAVRVNAIAPGTVLWAEGKSTPTEMEKKKAIEKTVLKRQAALSSILQTALFLIDNEDITGQVIAVDAGKSLRGALVE